MDDRLKELYDRETEAILFFDERRTKISDRIYDLTVEIEELKQSLIDLEDEEKFIDTKFQAERETILNELYMTD